jgi:spore maturation protein CgeB
MSSLFDENLEALASASPAAAAAVASIATSLDGWSTGLATTGEPIVERDGRPLDSRRDPRQQARRAAADCPAGRVVVAGFGSGYFAEALLQRGIQVQALLEADAACLAAAMRARDLRELLARVPVTLTGALKDVVALATVRARADVIVAHPPSVAMSPELASLVAAWPSMRVARRRPRVLVVGPIYGGSLEVARSAHAACSAIGAEARLFDCTVFADGHHALSGLDVPKATRAALHGGYASVLADAVVSVAYEWKADLVFALAQAPLVPRAIDALKQLNIRSAFWFVENNRVLTYWKDVAAHYDWFYGIQENGFLERLAQAGAPQPRYLPVACDPERHRPLTLTADERVRFGSDVSFAGSPYLNRRRMFTGIADMNLRLWGGGWDDPLLGHLMAEEGRTFDIDDMVRVFCASSINLNLHSANHVTGIDPEPDFVNPRTFELAACQAFQLVDRRDPLPALFASDELVTFTTAAEMRAQIKWYLARPEERAQMAARARTRALAEHTYAHRMRQVLADTLSPELAGAAFAGAPVETLDDAIVRLEKESPRLAYDEAVLRIVREVNSAWMGR